MIPIGDKAYAAIIAWEVGSRAAYGPGHLEWPGGDSGVTGGFGYDFGQQSKDQIAADWGGILDPITVKRLTQLSGITGARAETWLVSFADVTITWEQAEKVFRNRDVPRYTAETLTAFPGAEILPPDALGALVSLVFNRGPSMGMPNADGTPDRRLEMREIRTYVRAGHFAAVPDLLRKMARVWAGTSIAAGMKARRDGEANLFEQALADARPGGEYVPQVVAQSVTLEPSADDLNAAELSRIQQENT